MGGILHIKDRMPATTPKICNKAFFSQAPPQLYVKPDAITPGLTLKRKRQAVTNWNSQTGKQINLVS